ncbi:DUF998 domain-containing protein [Sphaerisporangium sp. TRM90804]|uniref:DUF998 domain-containing protein n=1 Tax=Sphaerisporangium sp. TRM90804 TaxID=3031113 RepID=UPI002447DFA8|nr:DUF998 domain-containing protein [Sphaerisporangium sp. TRM90804]MDH2426592.1 DUF998 domain-containing protein [Sphaerisporangium sp. TRM90804]
MLPLRRLYPLLAVAGLLAALVMVAAGQIGVGHDRVGLTIGQYAALELGGATQLALALLGLSSLGVLAGMRVVGAPVEGWPERLVLVWAGSAVGAAMLPGTRVGEFLMVTAMAALAGAAALLARLFGDDERWRPVARPLEWLALAAGGAIAALIYVLLPGRGVMVGVVEWTLLGIAIAVLGVITAQLTRIAWTSEDADTQPAPAPTPALPLRNTGMRAPAPLANAAMMTALRTPHALPTMTMAMSASHPEDAHLAHTRGPALLTRY